MPCSIAWRGPDGLSTRPRQRISPASGAIRPARILSSVDLPAPFSPTSAWAPPAAMSKLTPVRALMAPKDLWMPSNCRLTRTDGSLPAHEEPALRAWRVDRDRLWIGAGGAAASRDTADADRDSCALRQDPGRAGRRGVHAQEHQRHRGARHYLRRHHHGVEDAGSRRRV